MQRLDLEGKELNKQRKFEERWGHQLNHHSIPIEGEPCVPLNSQVYHVRQVVILKVLFGLFNQHL